MRENLSEAIVIERTVMSPPYKDIADRLERIREAYGLSQSEFARRIGVQPHTYNGWLTGDKRPKIDTALIIREEFSVTLDYLYTGDHGALPVKLAHALRQRTRLS